MRDNKGKFIKGNTPWSFGVGHTEKTKEKISNSLKGKTTWNKGIPMSEETKKKISKLKIGNKNCLGKKHSEETKRKIGEKSKGRLFDKETRIKMSKSHIGKHNGDKNWNWKGGLSFEPYGLEFNNQLREKIRRRDGYRCRQCFRHQEELKRKLHTHHIDFNKQNNNPNNLISLCHNCHAQTNYNRKDWTKYFAKQMESTCNITEISP